MKPTDMTDPNVSVLAGRRTVLTPADNRALESALAPLADLSPSTLSNYRSNLRGWWRWCEAGGRRPWPARPDDVAAYVAELLGGGMHLTYARHRITTVLGGAHRRAGLPDPAAGAAVRALLRPDRAGEPWHRLAAQDEATLDSLLAPLADLSPSTLRNYRSNLRGWWRWCEANGRRPWPARPDDVAVCVADLLDGGAGWRNVRHRISTVLGGVHRRGGLPDPAAGEAVRALLRPIADGQRRSRFPARDDAAIDSILAPLGDLSWHTLTQYRSSLRAWWRWCAVNSRSPWPARADDVAAYVAELLAGGASLRSARVRITTVVGGAHRRGGLPDPSAADSVQMLLWPDRGDRDVASAGFASPWRGGLSARDEAAIDSVVAFFGDLTEGTIRNYRSSLRAWWRWCATRSRPPWPVQTDDLAMYAAEPPDCDGDTLATKRRVSQVLASAHRHACLPDPRPAGVGARDP